MAQTGMANKERLDTMATGPTKSISSQPSLMPGTPVRTVATNTTRIDPPVALGILLLNTKSIPLDW